MGFRLRATEPLHQDDCAGSIGELPRKVLGSDRWLPRKLLGRFTKVTTVTKSYKVHNRVYNRSSSFLGVNVGLDPVRNLSRSGLKPNEDDQDA